jgi:hypothetical protein
MSKFLLNLLVEILKVLPKFQKSLKFKNLIFLSIPPWDPAQPTQLHHAGLPLLQDIVPFVGPPDPCVPLAYSVVHFFI